MHQVVAAILSLAFVASSYLGDWIKNNKLDFGKLKSSTSVSESASEEETSEELEMVEFTEDQKFNATLILNNDLELVLPVKLQVLLDAGFEPSANLDSKYLDGKAKEEYFPLYYDVNSLPGLKTTSGQYITLTVTNPSDDKQSFTECNVTSIQINAVDFPSDDYTVMLGNGIGIGSSFEDVKTAYGDGYVYETANNYIHELQYGNEDKDIFFKWNLADSDEEKVTTITIRNK